MTKPTRWRLTEIGEALLLAPVPLQIAALLLFPEGTASVLRAYKGEPATYQEVLKRLGIDMMEDIPKAGMVLAAALHLINNRMIAKVSE